MGLPKCLIALGFGLGIARDGICSSGHERQDRSKTLGSPREMPAGCGPNVRPEPCLQALDTETRYHCNSNPLFAAVQQNLVF